MVTRRESTVTEGPNGEEVTVRKKAARKGAWTDTYGRLTQELEKAGGILTNGNEDESSIFGEIHR